MGFKSVDFFSLSGEGKWSVKDAGEMEDLEGDKEKPIEEIRNMEYERITKWKGWKMSREKTKGN